MVSRIGNLYPETLFTMHNWKWIAIDKGEVPLTVKYITSSIDHTGEI